MLVNTLSLTGTTCPAVLVVGLCETDAAVDVGENAVFIQLSILTRRWASIAVR